MMLPLGNAAAHHAFAAAMRSGQLHHAWLLTGPKGVGKANFARAAALRLLAEAAQPGMLPPGFDVPACPTRNWFDKGNHPDYRELARLPREASKPDGELARSITIAQVRALQPLFMTKPSMSARRVILIDAADDLERPGASNALLKNLEEPPAGTIFLLISHAPGNLLPTIRSRCRRLRFDPLDETEMRAVLAAAIPDAGAGEIDALVRIGEGSPGRALAYAGLDMARLDAIMTSIAANGDPDHAERTALAKLLGVKAAQVRYEAVLDHIPSLIARHAHGCTGEPLRISLDAYDAAQAIAAGARGLSLDPQATIHELAGLIARLASPRL